MTRDHVEHHHKPDEIKKQFWKYRRVQLIFIALLFLASYLLPKIPLLHGWEYKFTTAAVEIAKTEIPSQAVRIKTVDEALALFPTTNQNLKDYINLNGPIPIASWPCQVVAQNALCIRYLWKGNEPLTLVVTKIGKKLRKKAGPFTKSAWAGYYFLSTEKDLAFTVVGSFEPEDILSTLNLPKK